MDRDTKIITLYDKILIEKLENKEQKTSAGIILPSDKSNAVFKAMVLETGEGRLTPEGKIIPLHVSTGDIVLVASHAGIKITDKMSVISESEILGILPDEATYKRKLD